MDNPILSVYTVKTLNTDTLYNSKILYNISSICTNVYLENINLILAFIINIISQPIELLNISSAFNVYLIRKCNWISVACVAQWVEHVNIAHLYF